MRSLFVFAVSLFLSVQVHGKDEWTLTYEGIDQSGVSDKSIVIDYMVGDSVVITSQHIAEMFDLNEAQTASVRFTEQDWRAGDVLLDVGEIILFPFGVRDAEDYWLVFEHPEHGRITCHLQVSVYWHEGMGNSHLNACGQVPLGLMGKIVNFSEFTVNPFVRD
ncbi:MAG: hypothetical protein OXK80_05345 [Bdellovibrionales bacterium]|nr:hypothetical protein [Bdellovibrionales bacterium]